MNEYRIPASPGESELTEKRSRFLGHVRMVESEEEAKAFIAEMKRKYYDARHNCWCYAVRGGAERYSDDGEPQGSAGIPMLEVLRRRGVTNAVCVVTRYFGGVLLGTGGLLRAYTQSTADALDAAGIAVVRAWTEAEARCSYAQAERMKTEAAALGAVTEDVVYGADVTLKLLIPREKTEAVKARLFDASAGSVRLAVTGESFRAVPEA